MVFLPKTSVAALFLVIAACAVADDVPQTKVVTTNSGVVEPKVGAADVNASKAESTLKPSEIISSTVSPSNGTISIQPEPSTITPSTTTPTTTTTTTTTTTETAPNTTTTIKPAPNTTTTTVAPTPSPITTTTTPIPSTTTPSSNVTTTSAPPPPPPGRKWDAPSFFGGMVLAFGIVAVGFVGYRFFYLGRGGAYHTL